MAYTIAYCFTQAQRYFPEITQAEFIDLINEVDNEIQPQVKLVPQNTASINLVAGTATYAIGDAVDRIWDVAYISGVGQYLKLIPTSFDYLDYQMPGWRNVVASVPSMYYYDGGNIGLYPPPGTTTVAGYPIIQLAEQTQNAAYGIGGSLPGAPHTPDAWVFGVCFKWAAMHHRGEAQQWMAAYKDKIDDLKVYISGRNVRKKPKIHVRTQPIRYV